MKFKAGNSLWYTVLRVVAFFTAHLFYRRFYFKNIGQIPANGGLIFAPNHQSAFMDAIIVSLMLKKQNRFLVRADIFKNPKARKALVAMNLLPIYRIRDGVDSMDKNEQIFKTSEDALLREESMVLFPEGNQANQWKLRPLKKGYARIAFGALDRSKNETDLYIIPTGINYYNFTGYRGELVVEYGEPIKINDYKELINKNEAKAINELKVDLSGKMSKLLFNIRDNENYEAIKEVSHILVSPKEELKVDFETRKKFFDSFQNDSIKEDLLARTLGLADKLENKEVTGEEFRFSRLGKLGIVLVPFFYILSLLSKVITAPLLLPIEKLVNNKIKDIHFKASIRFVLSMFGYPLLILLLLLLLCLIFGWGIGLIIVLGLSTIAYLGLKCTDKLRFWSQRKIVRSKVKDYKSFSEEIEKEVTSILSLIA